MVVKNSPAHLKKFLHKISITHIGMGFAEMLVMTLSVILFILTFPISMCLSFRIINVYERAVILRLGKVLGEPKGPGMIFILPCTDNCYRVDLRVVSFDVPPQEALTKDSVTVQVDAVVYYRIQEPLLSVVKVADYSSSTMLLAMTLLRNLLGQKTLHDILSEREKISDNLQRVLDVATDPWGVKVERVEIKDVRLPISMQRAMAAEAEATREAKAKVIAAEGEMKASKSLKEAAEVLNKSPGALQLRYLETLNTISGERQSTVVFPLPIDILSPFYKK